MGKNKPPRLTHQSMKVLNAFMENASAELSGAEINRQTKISSGTLYPILLRFEDAGLLNSNWEKGEPSELGRPRRRLYKITGEGVKAANDAFNSLGYGNWVRT